MDSIERSHEALARDVAGLTTTVAQVEANQRHAEKLNDLQFEALKGSLATLRGEVGTVAADLKGFMARVEGLITGEVQLPYQRDLMADWTGWRKDVDRDREGQAVLNGQIRLLGRLAVILATTNLLGLAAAVYAAIKP